MTGAVSTLTQARIAGHFGEFLQGRLGPDGSVCLVTVPCQALGVTAVAASGFFDVDGCVEPAIAHRFFEALGDLPQASFQLHNDAVIGGGAGMSTAALFAMAEASGAKGDWVQAALAAEGAVDPLLETEHVLWASREGRVIERFLPVPEFDVVGGFWGAPEPTDPNDNNFADIADLVAMWRAAANREDRAALAGLSTESARRVTALRGPADDPTLDLARELGALGILRAHTGSARGLLFAPGRSDPSAARALSEAGFADVLQFRTGGAP